VVAQPSLSVVLPVHNAEQTLAARLVQLLDLLPDLTNRFEVLVLNDGSTDHTEEVAYELARVYPQVRVTRHDRRRGRQGVVETGLAETTGDILLIQDEEAAIDSSKFRRLWQLRDEEGLVFSQPELSVRGDMLHRVAAWGVRLEETTEGGSSAGVQMIHRRWMAQTDRVTRTDKVREMESAPPPSRSKSTRPDLPRASQPSSKFNVVRGRHAPS
jgi:glycosyltransferase involved in cell wall biosynthesis